MFDNDDEQWMRMAIEVARSKGSDPSTSPLGCVIVLDGKVLAAKRNQTQKLPYATAHAEMMAIRWVVIGGGLRLPPKSLGLFEMVVNLIHKGAPNAAIAFNSRPEDTAEAAARQLGRA